MWEGRERGNVTKGQVVSPSFTVIFKMRKGTTVLTKGVPQHKEYEAPPDTSPEGRSEACFLGVPVPHGARAHTTCSGRTALPARCEHCRPAGGRGVGRMEGRSKDDDIFSAFVSHSIALNRDQRDGVQENVAKIFFPIWCKTLTD